MQKANYVVFVIPKREDQEALGKGLQIWDHNRRRITIEALLVET